ncbi:hypothetical protein D3C80_949270 [compost metagenome]
MALKKTFGFKGVLVEDGYIRVMTPAIHPGNISFEFAVHYMATPEDESLKADVYNAPYTLLGGNPIEQAYEYLKTLPEFSDAIDC